MPFHKSLLHYEYPYMIKNLAGMGPNFKRVTVYPVAHDEHDTRAVWAVQFTSGCSWTLCEGNGYQGHTTCIVERVNTVNTRSV